MKSSRPSGAPSFPSFDQSRNKLNISPQNFDQTEVEAEPSLPGAAVLQDVSGNHQLVEWCMYSANKTQYLAELCTLLVEDVLGPFFAVGGTHSGASTTH